MNNCSICGLGSFAQCAQRDRYELFILFFRNFLLGAHNELENRELIVNPSLE